MITLPERASRTRPVLAWWFLLGPTCPQRNQSAPILDGTCKRGPALQESSRTRILYLQAAAQLTVCGAPGRETGFGIGAWRARGPRRRAPRHRVMDRGRAEQRWQTR